MSLLEASQRAHSNAFGVFAAGAVQAVYNLDVPLIVRIALLPLITDVRRDERNDEPPDSTVTFF